MGLQYGGYGLGMSPLQSFAGDPLPAWYWLVPAQPKVTSMSNPSAKTKIFLSSMTSPHFLALVNGYLIALAIRDRRFQVATLATPRLSLPDTRCLGSK